MKKIILAAVAALTLSFGVSTASAADLTIGGVTAKPYVAVSAGLGVVPESADDYEDATVANFATGLDFGTVRTELEYTNLDNGKADFGASVDANIVGLNVIAEPVTVAGFTPYLGVGVGYAFLEGTGTDNGKNGVVYNVQLGTSYEINQNWALTAGYKYLVSADDRVRQNDGTLDNYEQHIYTAGVRYTF